MSRRGRPPPTATEEHVRVLQQLARVRVFTAPQAHRLVDHLAVHTLDNAYRRLQTLTRKGLLRSQIVRPDRGRFSPIFYMLTSPALRLLKREGDRQLLARPAQHILEYLLFRNEVYAAARAAGWLVVSPVLTPPDFHARALDAFRAWAVDAKKREAALLQGAGRPAGEVSRALQEVERLPRFLPTALTFEFLLKRDRRSGHSDLVLLVLDDPRRAAKTQAAGLPIVSAAQHQVLPDGRLLALPGLRLLVRDASSRYDLAAHSVYRPSSRLKLWRRLLSERYGEDAIRVESTDELQALRAELARLELAAAGDQVAQLALAAKRRQLAAWPPILFPDLWAHRINAPSDVHPQAHWKEHHS